ncbi:hypothetical protein G5V57_00495 [Nordella sp. HKS 07]|uniref:hypothetical protein n=1 Tax=Nordella sp. HKS 07 TaxID=2712222 RepID=UPI0013E19F59|nr:hypothetical protein [Nordella sp. HKS 07]QIG46367.1 hypothetical protein G5V57_00495 [Nordella sp. HKS 07]
MSARGFSRLAAVIFAIVALAHLLRAAAGLDIAIGAESIPIWVSWVGAVVAGFLAYLGFTASG